MKARFYGMGTIREDRAEQLERLQERVSELYRIGAVDKCVIVTPTTQSYAHEVLNRFLDGNPWSVYEQYRDEGYSIEDISTIFCFRNL